MSHRPASFWLQIFIWFDKCYCNDTHINRIMLKEEESDTYSSKSMLHWVVFSMKFGHSSSLNLQLTHPPLNKTYTSISGSHWRKKKVLIQSFSVSYQNFNNFAMDETRQSTHLVPSPLQVGPSICTILDYLHYGFLSSLSPPLGIV